VSLGKQRGNTFNFRVKQSKKNYALDVFTLTMKALRSFESSETISPTIQSSIPEEWNI